MKKTKLADLVPEQVIIKPHGDSLDNWKNENPILRKNEITVAYSEHTEAPFYKLGDGIHHYQDLPYVTIDRALEYGIIYTYGVQVKMEGFIKPPKGEN